jgi:hypothetical protein
MNKKYLGDAFDHWKGSLIQILNDNGAIQNLAVEPMITDEKKWGNNDLEMYKKLLNLPETSKICHRSKTFRNDRRQEYFKNDISEKCDLFLDPNTGIAPGHPPENRVKIKEIKYLLERNGVLMIYQHLARNSAKNQRSILEKRIEKIGVPRHYCVYQCGQVAMIFISRKQNRIEKIKKTLKSYLCGTAAKRIWPE